MATTQHTCFTAVCDECHDAYENDLVIHFDSPEEAEAGAVGDSWQHLPDGRLLCPRCVGQLEARGEIEENPDGTFRAAEPASA
jgi:hypothetical protein